jgi:hypothetical protein
LNSPPITHPKTVKRIPTPPNSKSVLTDKAKEQNMSQATQVNNIDIALGQLTREQAAEQIPFQQHVGSPLLLLDRLIARGSLPARAMGDGSVRVLVEDLKAFLANGPTTTATEKAFGITPENITPLIPIVNDQWFNLPEFAYSASQFQQAMQRELEKVPIEMIAQVNFPDNKTSKIDGEMVLDLTALSDGKILSSNALYKMTGAEATAAIKIQKEVAQAIKALIQQPVSEAGTLKTAFPVGLPSFPDRAIKNAWEKARSTFKNIGELFLTKQLQDFTSPTCDGSCGLLYRTPGDAYNTCITTGIDNFRARGDISYTRWFPSLAGPTGNPRRVRVSLPSQDIMSVAGTNVGNLARLAF